ncbi:MAG: hypothetical protein RLZZ04_2888 [Cyanobacteriota bacterium]
MADNFSVEKSSNKSFIANHHSLLKDYAQQKKQIFGFGIIVVNLLLLKPEKIDELNLLDPDVIEQQEATVHQPISYVPLGNFWFKLITLKIKKKHQIDLQAKNSSDRVPIVFIKDAAIEHFSIYTIRSGNRQS